MDESKGSDLRKYLQILRRRWPLILLVVAVTATSAYLFSTRMKRVYRGATEVQVQPFSSTGSGASQTQDLLNLFANPTLVLQTDVKLIESDSVLGPAAKDLGLASSLPLKAALSVQLIANTQILEIDVDTHVPAQSRDWANQIAASFINFQRAQVISQVTASNAEATTRVTAANADIAKRLDALKGQIQAAVRSPVSDTVIAGLTAQQTALAASLQPVPTASTLGTGGPSVIVPAATPVIPISPKIRQNILLGALLGLLLAAGLVLLGEALDDRLRSAEEVEESAGAPTLGYVPYTKELAGKEATPTIVHDSSSLVAEAYRTVRTNLRFLSVERPIKSLLVTSSVKGEGKSTTAANLAAAFALSGVKTILVSADLRRPTVHKFFGLPNSEGLVDALLPGADLEQLLQKNELPDFRLLSAGRIPPNPTEILSSSRFGDILRTLESAADLVIIDSTPLLGIADASALASRVDGVLLVVNPKEVNRRTLVHATEQLHKAGGRVLGTLLNAVSTGRGHGYGYGYDYDYYYAEDKERKRSKKKACRHPPGESGAKEESQAHSNHQERAEPSSNGRVRSQEAHQESRDELSPGLATASRNEEGVSAASAQQDQPDQMPAEAAPGARADAGTPPDLKIWDSEDVASSAPGSPQGASRGAPSEGDNATSTVAASGRPPKPRRHRRFPRPSMVTTPDPEE